LPKYMVVSRSRVVGVYEEFLDALEAVAETGGGEVYRVELVAKLDEEEARALKEALLPTATEPVEAPVRKEKEQGVAIVLDRGFTADEARRILEAVPKAKLYLLSEEAEAEKRLEDIVVLPARSSSEASSIVEELRLRGLEVILVTRDKKLYTHLSLSGKARAIYYSSTELDKLVEELTKLLK